MSFLSLANRGEEHRCRERRSSSIRERGVFIFFSQCVPGMEFPFCGALVKVFRPVLGRVTVGGFELLPAEMRVCRIDDNVHDSRFGIEGKVEWTTCKEFMEQNVWAG